MSSCWKSGRKHERKNKEKISKCIDTLLGQRNLCSCFEKSPTNLLYEENIIIVCFIEKEFMFLIYILHVIKYIKTQSIEKSILCLTDHMWFNLFLRKDL